MDESKFIERIKNVESNNHSHRHKHGYTPVSYHMSHMGGVSAGKTPASF